MSENEQGGCPICGGELLGTTKESDIFGLTAVTEHCICQTCGEVIVTPEQSRRNKKAVIAVRELVEARLRDMIARRHGCFRVEQNGGVQKLVGDELLSELCAQPPRELRECVHKVVDRARMRHMGSFVQVLGNGQARVLFDKPPTMFGGDSDE